VQRQKRAREHRTALRSRPSSAARGARPGQDPGGHHHHAGPSQPRRHCALSSTAKPAPRPPSCGCSTAPRHHVQSQVQKQKAHSRAEHWSSPRAPQAQKKAPRQEGSKTASRAARNKRKQLAFAYKCDAHRACRCGGIAERDERLAVFVLQSNSTAEKGARVGGRSQGKQRSEAPPASQVRQGGPRGNAPPWHVNHAHNTPAHELGKQRRQPRCACAGQTRQPQERTPPPSSQGRAAAAAPAPRASYGPVRLRHLTKQNDHRATCNLELQNLYLDWALIKKTLPTAVQLN